GNPPGTWVGSEKSGNVYGVAATDNGAAPPLTAANPAPAPWTREELYDYLRTGASKLHGTAAGPMSPVVQGLAALPDSDVRAIAIYFADVDKAADRLPSVSAAVGHAMSFASAKVDDRFDTDARLYTAACASCHYNSGSLPLAARPDLALNSAAHLSDPSNLIQVILRGISADEGMPDVVMPAFGGALSDADVARIVADLRRTRPRRPPWPDRPAKLEAIRRQHGATDSPLSEIEPDLVPHQWSRGDGRGRGRHATVVGNPRCHRPHWNEVRLRHRNVRRLHGSRR